jgi:hypothetical protein
LQSSPISISFIRIALPVTLPVAGGVAKPFLVTQFLLGPVICIGFHFVSLPCRLSGTLTVRLFAIILLAIAGHEKRAAVNTGDLLHIAAPINGMNENNYMDF